jgi:hypothetical protein
MAQGATTFDDMRGAMAEATAAMERHNMPYALIGGLATSYRSQPWFTKAIDFLVKVVIPSNRLI